MSNSLATRTGALAPANGDLAPRLAVIQEIQQEDEHGYRVVVPRIKMPSGGMLIFEMDGDAKKAFEGLIIASSVSRAFWPETDVQGLPPMCSSADGIVGYLTEGAAEGDLWQAAKAMPIAHWALGDADRTSMPCAACAMAKFGSGGGRRPACKELRRLVVWPRGGQLPALFTLPPTSIFVFDKYASGLRAQGEAYFSVWTKFSLEEARNASGIAYARIKLENSGPLDEAMLGEVRSLRAQFGHLIKDAEVGVEDYATVVEPAPF